nr:hypothetical protein Q903MT_gene6308 [Picea sitchensis]
MVPKAGDNSSGLRPSLPTFYHIDCARVPRITQIIPNARKTANTMQKWFMFPGG